MLIGIMLSLLAIIPGGEIKKKKTNQQLQLKFQNHPRSGRPVREPFHVPHRLQHWHVAVDPGLLPLLRGHVQQDLAGPQDHSDDQGGGQDGELTDDHS